MVISSAAKATIKAARIIKAKRAARIVKTTKARRTVKKPVSWSTKKRELQVSAPGDPYELAKYQALLRTAEAEGVKLSKSDSAVLKAQAIQLKRRFQPTRPGALFQRTPKRKADPFDKITKNFEGYNPAVFNAELGVPYKKGFHGNWLSKIDYDKLKPRKLDVQKSGDAVETAAGIAAAGAWTPILGFHITGQYDKTKKAKLEDKKPGKR